MEIWRNIPEWEGMYQVSNKGQVRSLDKKHLGRFGKPVLRKGRILKPLAKGGRYLAVTLADGGKRKQCFIHDLVLRAFAGAKPKGLQVCHVNDDKNDNRLENLRYGTPKENTADAIRNGVKPKGENRGVARLSNDDVLKIRNCAESNKELAQRYGVSHSHIWSIRKRRVWKHL